MSVSSPIHPETSALLVMDFQKVLLANHVAPTDAANALERTSALLAAARRAGVHVVYVQVAFRRGYPEVSARNRLFASLQASGLFARDAADTSIHPDVAPRNDEPVVIKHRIGAFSDTDLDMLLRANRIDTLILAGVTTAGVVLSTVRQAFDRDYRIVVASDCCVDADPDVHRILLDRIITQHAEVASAESVIASLAAAIAQTHSLDS